MQLFERNYDSSIFQVSYSSFASIVAVSFAFFWSSYTFVDFSIYRWLSIVLIFIFIFLFIKKQGARPNIMVTCFLVMTLAPSFILSVDPIYSSAQLLRLVSTILFCVFLSSLNIDSKFRVFRFAVHTIAIMTIISAIFYPVLNDSIAQLVVDRPRYSGMFYHANITGFCSGLTVLFFVYLLMFERQKKYSYLVLLLLSCFVLIKSDSRSALLSVIFGVLVLFFTKKQWAGYSKILAAFIFFLSLVPLIVTLFIGSIELGNNSYNDSLYERFHLWNEALTLFKDSVFFGNGYGLAFDTGEVTWDGEFIYYPYAHNLVLNTLAWSGVMGLFLVVAIFYILFKSSAISDISQGRLLVLAKAYIFYVVTWSILDGALQAMWITHLFFWLSASVILGNNKSLTQKVGT
jgi:O-antigen ligase